MARPKKERLEWKPLPPDICIICRKHQSERGGWYCSEWHDLPYVLPDWNEESGG